MIKLGVIMNSIKFININKDSTFAMLLEAQRRNYIIYYIEDNSLILNNNTLLANSYLIKVRKNYNNWYQLYNRKILDLSTLHVILMRKDPPVNNDYFYITYMLEQVKKNGVLIINEPSSLRNYNEKILPIMINKHIPNTIITCNKYDIRKFVNRYKNIILKPLNYMGGKSVFFINKNDINFSVIVETMTDYGNKFCIAQEFLPVMKYGDKRVLIINGRPISHCLIRFPKQGELRGNIVAGGKGKVMPLNDNDYEIVNSLSSFLIKNGLIFVGLDIIKDKITEINFTSPTCIIEIESSTNISITSILMDYIESKLSKINNLL
ncbi:MAG: glutathione synthase [Candidatus Lightella neohaematopini]|nr:glutathione synthase [Candidatus Lightella neohaematopini]